MSGSVHSLSGEMPKSKTPKLFPLFYKKPNASNLVVIDGSDSDEDDDLPLTCLLDTSNQQRPHNNKKQFNSRKQKKRKCQASKRESITAARKNNHPIFERRKKPKQTKLSNGTQAGGNQQTVISNETVIAPKNPTLLSTNHSNLNASGHNTNGVERVVSVESNNSTASATETTVNQRRQGLLLYSEASMDFVPPPNLQSRAKAAGNIFHKLNRRMYHGGCLFPHPQIRHFSPDSKARIEQKKRSAMPSSVTWPKKWKIPSWISLEQPMVNDNKVIDHIQWDPMGVLLAVAIDRTIIIYDWDMLRAADVQGRRDQRRQQESAFQIPPICKFRLPQPVASLLWNPFDMDELAVGFR